MNFSFSSQITQGELSLCMYVSSARWVFLGAAQSIFAPHKYGNSKRTKTRRKSLIPTPQKTCVNEFSHLNVATATNRYFCPNMKYEGAAYAFCNNSYCLSFHISCEYCIQSNWISRTKSMNFQIGIPLEGLEANQKHLPAVCVYSTKAYLLAIST